MVNSELRKLNIPHRTSESRLNINKTTKKEIETNKSSIILLIKEDLFFYVSLRDEANIKE